MFAKGVPAFRVTAWGTFSGTLQLLQGFHSVLQCFTSVSAVSLQTRLHLGLTDQVAFGAPLFLFPQHSVLINWALPKFPNALTTFLI